MRTICLVTANRADWSRGETIAEAIVARPDLKLKLVVMGSHLLEKHGFTGREIESRFPVAARIHMELDGKNPETMAKSVGLATTELSTLFGNMKPDIVIALVDRYENFAVATAAALMNIPVAHVQGGEVTGTIDESLRHAITKLSHLHFPANADAAARIVKMGEPAERVFDVGCPGTDLLLRAPVWDRTETIRRVNDIGKDPAKRRNGAAPYALVLQHPVTTEFGSGAEQIEATLEAVAGLGLQAVMLWPNIDAGSDDVSHGIRRFETARLDVSLSVYKHFPSELFVNLMRNAAVMIGNSSSGVREACYFGTPVVNIGTRQAGRARAKDVRDVGYDAAAILEAAKEQVAHGPYAPEHLYGDGKAGEKIAEILATVDVRDVQKRIVY